MNDEIRGTWFVQSYLVHDAAALNKMEMLCWDCWGLADNSPGEVPSEDEGILLDRLAWLTLAGDEALSEVWERYHNDERIRVPSTVQCYSPAGRRAVEL